MGIINVLSYLKEELNDIPAVPKNIHNTNFEGLYGILKSGKLKGNSYTVKTSVTKDYNQELCTTRNTHKLSDTEKRGLSLTADGGVRIELFSDRIRTAHRGTKLRPIAELPIQEKVNIKRDKKEFEDTWGFEPPNLVDKNHKYDKEVGKAYTFDYAKRHHLSVPQKVSLNYDINHYNNSIAFYYKELENREREERFILESPIPVNPKYMRIVLETDVDGIKNWDFQFIHKHAGTFLDLMEKHSSVFKKDKNYNEFVDYLKWFIADKAKGEE